MMLYETQLININIYLPCSGTADRLMSYDSLLDDLRYWRDRYRDCKCVIGGDFNVNIDNNDAVASRLNGFINDYMFTRCDDLFPAQKCSTYVKSFVKSRKLYRLLFSLHGMLCK